MTVFTFIAGFAQPTLRSSPNFFPVLCICMLSLDDGISEIPGWLAGGGFRVSDRQAPRDAGAHAATRRIRRATTAIPLDDLHGHERWRLLIAGTAFSTTCRQSLGEYGYLNLIGFAHNAFGRSSWEALVRGWDGGCCAGFIF